jgi:hypothetical protein
MKKRYNPPSIEDFRDMTNYHIAHKYYETYYNVNIFKLSDDTTPLDNLMLRADDNFDKFEMNYFNQFNKGKNPQSLKESFNFYSDDKEYISYKGIIKLFRDLNINTDNINEEDFMVYEDFVDFMNNKSFTKHII